MVASLKSSFVRHGEILPNRLSFAASNTASNSSRRNTAVSNGAEVGSSAGKSAFLLAVILLLASGGCASGSAAAGGKTADDTEPQAEYESASEDSGDTATQPDEKQIDSTACTGEGCFACGEGMCLDGFYCDEGATGGPACAWLPECAKAPTCDCVTGVLGSSCRCEARDGGVYAACE